MMKMNKVIAAIMMMAITTAMPAMAGTKKESHFDRVEMKTSHFDKNNHHAYHPDVKTCTFKMSRHESHNKFANKVELMKGVLETKWNPRTREVTVIYDAKVTSAHNIRRFMA